MDLTTSRIRSLNDEWRCNLHDGHAVMTASAALGPGAVARLSLTLHRNGAPTIWRLTHRPAGEPASTFVQAAVRFDEIGKALTARLCSSGEPQYPRPFAAGLAICDRAIGRAENHDAERPSSHFWCIVLQAEGRPRIFLPRS